MIGNDDAMMDRAHSHHNLARPHGPFMERGEHGYVGVGTKARITEFQAPIVITQMGTAGQEIARREENGKYLASRLKEIPGIVPRKEYPETTRLSHHTYGFRYKAELFDGLPRDQFLLIFALPMIARGGPGPCVSGFRWKPSVHWLCEAQ